MTTACSTVGSYGSLLPVPLRNVALTAMELATIERLHPGRLLPGIGHGVLEWMGRAGARVESPMTLLREQASALRALLGGESVSTSGRYVELDDVALRWPPDRVPPLLVGAVRPKTVALAGELGDGVIFTGSASADAVRAGVELAAEVRAAAGIDRPFEVVAFAEAATEASVGSIVETVTRLAAAGATRVPVCAIDRGPDGSDAILGFAERLGAFKDALA